MKAIVGYVKEFNKEVIIHGSKNSALPIIASLLLFNTTVNLSNVPDITDIEKMHHILKYLNIDITKISNSFTYKTNNISFQNLLFEEVKDIRASYYLWPVILSKRNSLKSFLPGGCTFQDRPIDIHLYILKKFGYSYIIKNDIIEFKKNSKVKKYLNLKGINFSFGATINAILMSVKGNKITKIYNYAKEPEVMDLVNFLRTSGAKISIKKNYIKIVGVKKLSINSYSIMMDRIEAGSYILLTLSHPNSILKIKYFDIETIRNIINLFIEAGGKFSIENQYMHFHSPKVINRINVTSSIYPAFPTDLQQILCSSLFSTCSKITDLVYPNRTSHIGELKKLDFKIIHENGKICINPSVLRNNNLKGIDLRGTFGLIVASSNIEGDTIIDDVDNVLRGYSELKRNLNNLGIKFEII